MNPWYFMYEGGKEKWMDGYHVLLKTCAVISAKQLPFLQQAVAFPGQDSQAF